MTSVDVPEPGGRRRLLIAALAIALVALAGGVLLAISRSQLGGEVQGISADALDPSTLAWERVELVDLAAAGVVEISQLAVVGGRFVGFATGPFDEVRQVPDTAVLVSSDGVRWEAVTGPIADVRVDFAISVDGEIRAFGQTGPANAPDHQIWTSRDGLAWERIEDVQGLDFGPGFISSVGWTEAGWVAGGWAEIDVETSTPMILASTDGRAWERSVLPRQGLVQLQSITTGPAGFVVAVTFEDDLGAQHAAAWHSRDGRTWAEHLIERGQQLVSVSDVAATDGGYVAVGYDDAPVEWRPAVWTSPDGQSWRRNEVEEPGGDGQVVMNSVHRAGRGLLSLGMAFGVDDRPVAWTSLDGTRWQFIRDWPGQFGDVPATAAATGRLVVVAGQQGIEEGTFPVVWLGAPP